MEQIITIQKTLQILTNEYNKEYERFHFLEEKIKLLEIEEKKKIKEQNEINLQIEVNSFLSSSYSLSHLLSQLLSLS